MSDEKGAAAQPAWVTFAKLLVSDLEAEAAFYKQVCGVTELARVKSDIAGRALEEIIFRRAEQGGMQFILVKYLDQETPRNGEAIVGITTDDVAAFVDRAQRAGGEIVRPPRVMTEHGVAVAFVKDPEGHLIEVVQYLKA